MKKIIVLGGGISGYGSAILAKKMGFDVFLSDKGTLSAEFMSLLDTWEVEFEQGGHSEERILQADEVVKSPGIPDSAPIVMALRERGIPIISEIEFAGRYKGEAKCICISGSNGKTTTTSLIYKILQDAGCKVALGGNIGESFAYSVATRKVDYYVLEISSFQLDGMYDFRSDISVLMNITPDHLDRYDYNFEKYAKSKMRITQNQRVEDSFIYCADDEVIVSHLPDLQAQASSPALLPFGEENISSAGLLNIRSAKSQMQLSEEKMQLKGLHNCYNAMAAALTAMEIGIDAEQIAESVYSFSPVEHRLEPVAEVGGVLYINDSKATNVDSVWYALEAMKRPVVWIAGGTDKGNNYAPLMQFAAQKVHTLVCMGLDNSALQKAFEGVIPNIVCCSSPLRAFEASRAAAKAGDVVLLSPACASFDLFKNYEDRGRQFKDWVRRSRF